MKIGRETLKVRARDVEGEEREQLWRALTDLYPGYDRYAQKTSRQIPVVVLEWVDTGASGATLDQRVKPPR